MSIEAMKQALVIADKAMKDAIKYIDDLKVENAYLRQAIAEAENQFRDATELIKQEPVEHWSDCAVNREPAYPKGKCDCGGYTHSQPKAEREKELHNRHCNQNDWKGVCKYGDPNCPVIAKLIAEAEKQERNFCPRCGKRTNDIHTCTPPQPKREWVGLTDEEKSNLWEISRAALPRYATYANLIEAKLKERNDHSI